MSDHQDVNTDSYRWVMLLLYVLMALGIWTCWFAQAPLLTEYWQQPPLSIAPAAAALLLSLPGLVAILLAVATGRWVDTVGVRKMMILSGVFASIGFGLRPFFAESFLAQAILTAIAGYGACILTACLPATMIQWFGHEKGHTYIGIGAGSYFVGAGIGILVTANLFESLHAKGVFAIWSAVMVAVTIIWVLLARDKTAPGSQARERANFSSEFKKITQTKSSWLMLVYAIFISGMTVNVMQFLPGQMIDARGLPPPLAGTVVGIYAVAMGIGLAILPSFAGRVGKKRISIILLSLTLLLWIIYMAVPSWTTAGLLAFAVVFGFLFEAPWATGLAILEGLPGVTPANMGVVGGLWTMFVNTGVFFLPLIFAAIVQATGGPAGAGGMWAILIGYAVSLVAVLGVREGTRMRQAKAKKAYEAA